MRTEKKNLCLPKKIVKIKTNLLDLDFLRAETQDTF